MLIATLLMTGLDVAFASDSTSGDAAKNITPTGISLNYSTHTTARLKSFNLVAKLSPEGASGEVTFTSSAPSVASVNEQGEVTALKDGVTTIAANVGSLSASCKVTVKTVALKSIKFGKKSVSLSPGGTATIKPSFSPSNTSYKTLTWTSSDESVATVDQNGRVTALKVGSATITGRALNGVRQSCAVKVSLIKVSSVKLNKTSVSLALGRTYQLRATLAPSSAADKSVRWSSTKENVATVDENGLVTAVGEGSTVIRATATDGSKKYKNCTVKVSAVRVKSITLNKTSATVKIGDTLQLTSNVLPSNASFNSVTWASSNLSVATVDNGLVTGVSSGTSVITASTDKGKKKVSATIRVGNTDYTSIAVSFIGDCMLGGDPRKGSVRYGSDKEFENYANSNGGIDSVFANVKSIFQADDLTVANLECTLTNSTNYSSKKYIIRGKPSYASMLKRVGIDMVNLSNNHSYDCGSGGLSDTKSNLAKAGVAYTAYNGATSKTVKGVKIGFTSHLVGTTSVDKIKSSVASAKKSNKIVVAIFHWGTSTEWTYAVSNQEKTIAHAAIDAGADIVIGGHKHLVSGIEVYKGKHIVYDLGNFVTCITNTDDKDTFIFQKTFNIYSNGTVEDGGIKVIPASTTSKAGVNNCQPALLTGSDAQRVINKIKKYSASLSTPATID